MLLWSVLCLLLACGHGSGSLGPGSDGQAEQGPEISGSDAGQDGVADAPASEAADTDTLRSAAATTGRLVGAAVAPALLTTETVYADTLATEFSYVTPENVMKWGPTEPAPDTWNFSEADALVDFAEKHGMKVKGHALIWHTQLPTYINDTLTADELRAAMTRHIKTLVGHFKGRLRSWDVVNEAIADGGAGRRPTIFQNKLGDGYIAEAFKLAHDADPDALLNYNDYGGEGGGAKSDAIYALVAGLVGSGVPIGGVGLQMHIKASGYPKPSDIAANMRRLAALGLKVNISEMDVQIRDLPAATKLDTQRTVYHDVVAICVAEPACEAITFWGFTDKHSWIDSFFGPDDPLLFDESYATKPGYFGVRDALLGR